MMILLLLFLQKQSLGFRYSMYTIIQALELRTTAGHVRLLLVVGERVHGATDFTSVLHPGSTEKRGNDSPPHSASGPAERASTVQPTLLPPRSGNYPRGKSVRTRRSLPTRKRVSVAQTERCGRPDHCASVGEQDRQLQTFPRGSNELNFGYHVSVWYSHGPRSRFP